MSEAKFENESRELENCLLGLAECEKEMDIAEKRAEIYRIKQTQEIYQKRREILKKIPKFWYIVLAENDDFAEYIGADDLKYLENINDIYVHYKAADTEVSDLKHYRDFSVTISLKDESTETIQQVTKHFETKIEDGEEALVSEAVSVEWPEELKAFNPKSIKESTKGKEMNKEDKRNYRQGMKSFFAWFGWTGLKPGKEFRNGEDLTRLIIDDLFPYAVKYYTEALPGIADDEDADSSEGEELDLSEDDEISPRKRTAPETEQSNKRHK